MEKIIFCSLLLVSMNPLAKEIKTKEQAIENICGDASVYAKQVMNGRQVGVMISDALKIANESNMPDEKLKFYKSIIYNAYKEPKVIDEALQVSIENEYSNSVYMTCSDAMMRNLPDTN